MRSKSPSLSSLQRGPVERPGGKLSHGDTPTAQDTLQRGPVERPGGKIAYLQRHRDAWPLQRGPVERPGGKASTWTATSRATAGFNGARSKDREERDLVLSQGRPKPCFNGARSKDREESSGSLQSPSRRSTLQRGPVERPGGKPTTATTPTGRLSCFNGARSKDREESRCCNASASAGIGFNGARSKDREESQRRLCFSVQRRASTGPGRKTGRKDRRSGPYRSRSPRLQRGPVERPGGKKRRTPITTYTLQASTGPGRKTGRKAPETRAASAGSRCFNGARSKDREERRGGTTDRYFSRWCSALQRGPVERPGGKRGDAVCSRGGRAASTGPGRKTGRKASAGTRCRSEALAASTGPGRKTGRKGPRGDPPISSWSLQRGPVERPGGKASGVARAGAAIEASTGPGRKTGRKVEVTRCAVEEGLPLQRGPVERPGGKISSVNALSPEGMLQRGPVERPGGKADTGRWSTALSTGLQRGPVERPGGKSGCCRWFRSASRFNGARSKDREESLPGLTKVLQMSTAHPASGPEKRPEPCP